MPEHSPTIGLNPNFSLSDSMKRPGVSPVSEVAQKSFDQFQQLQEAAFVDKLTGVYNQNAWNDFRSHIDYTRGDQFSIVMIDLNGLKDINDKGSHFAGDEYLKSTASYLASVFSRKGDRVFRTGGDEFVVVCEFIKPEDQNEFNSHYSSIFDPKLLEEKGLDFAYGIAHTDRQQDISFEDTFNRVDALMYQNKTVIKAANPDKYSR